ncbi:MAG: hypothetical protein WDA42_02055 [Candidatus Bathyarchaeia archaeon]
MTVLDQNLDLSGQEKHRLFTLYNAPAFVKTAAEVLIHGDEQLAPNEYADPLRKLYPCHTKAAVWTSAAFFYDCQNELPPMRAATIEDKLLKAAEIFGIRREVATIKQQIKDAQVDDLSQLPNEKFAYVVTNEDGQSTREYPLRNALEVKKAAEYLMQYRDDMPWAMRNTFATNVLRAAEEFGAGINDVRDELEKTAGFGLCSASDVVNALKQRARAARLNSDMQDLTEGLEKLAELINNNKSSMLQRQHMLVEFLDDVDRRANWTTRYNSDFSRPEEVIFGVTEKSAAALASRLIGSPFTGNYYQLSDLEQLPLNKLAEVMGEDMADAVSAGGVYIDTEKLAAVIPTLPREDADMFDQLTAVCGIAPFASKTAI